MADGLVENRLGGDSPLANWPLLGAASSQCRRANVKIEGREISSGSLLDSGLSAGESLA